MWDLYCAAPAWDLTQASLASDPAWCCTLAAGLDAAGGDLDGMIMMVGTAHGEFTCCLAGRLACL